MHCIGVLELTSKYRYGITSHGTPIYLFRPYDESLTEYIVGCSERDLSRNQIALVELPTIFVEQPNVRPRANLIRLIGPVGDLAAERKGLILHYGSHLAFKKTQIDPVDESLDGQRIEISSATGWYTYHVDPAGCRDIDDAIAYNRETGETAITIADAAALVAEGSAVDKAACAIGATFYDIEGRVILPMLPAAISEDAASLTPGHRRRGLTLIINRNGAETFVPSWITVEHSYTYESYRDHDATEVDPHHMIETLMIRYNKAAARVLKEAGVGLLRVQEEADAVAIASWAAISADLASMANEAASYVPGSNPVTSHASLKAAAYCHATSPIRRYADIVNQRWLKLLICGTGTALVNQETLLTLAAQLNARMKANRRWSRDLAFLTFVTPGFVHQISVVWVSDTLLWVPAWKRLIKARHERPTHLSGAPVLNDRISIFCDPSKRSWKTRILTAPGSP